MNRKCRILAITPYASLNKVIADIAGKYENIELEIYEGDLAAGVDIAYRMRNAGFDVILSRGTTALRIESQMDIPVVDIGYSGYDMYRAMTMGISMLSDPVILVSDALESDARTVCQIMNVELPMVTIENDYDERQYREHLEIIQKENRDLICYSNVVYTAAKVMGIDSILITSGDESVREALKTALKIYEVQVREGRRQEAYQKMLDRSAEPICLLEKGRLLYSNIKQKDQIKSLLEQIGIYKLLDIDKNNPAPAVSIGKKKYVLSGIRLDGEGDFLLYHIREPVERMADDAIVKVNKADSYFSDLHLFVGRERAKGLVEKAGKCYEERIPIHLFGATGTCKDRIAFELYKAAVQKDESFYQIKCIKVDRKAMQQLSDRLYDRSSENRTIFLDGIEFLDEESQRILFDLTQYARQLHIWFLSSSECNLNKSVENGLFSRKLYLALTGSVEVIPPLCGRKEDIQTLANAYITKLNADASNQIIRMNKAGMEYLKEYDWPMNILQLERVIKELAAQSQAGRIAASDVCRALEMEKMYYKDSYQSGMVNLEGSLDEIRTRIVNQVLKEEGMNQTRTAKRLGISRATLWKILKEQPER